MKERPIIFSSEMIRAILENRKTQTRRPVKGNLHQWSIPPARMVDGYFSRWGDLGECIKCPHGIPGDRLYVKETWACAKTKDLIPIPLFRADGELFFEDDSPIKWTSSIFMPKWASRITLEITNVRVEKLQEITEEDAKREGIEVMQRPESVGGGIRYFAPACGDRPPYWEYSAVTAFIYLWDSIYGKDAWDKNPWVWCISFRRVKP